MRLIHKSHLFFCSKSRIFPSHCRSFTEMQQPIAYLKKPIKLQGYLYSKGILQGYLYYILYKNNKRKKKNLQLPKDQFTTGSTKHLNRLKNRVSKNKQKTFWTKHEPIWLCSSLVSGLIISHSVPKKPSSQPKPACRKMSNRGAYYKNRYGGRR